MRIIVRRKMRFLGYLPILLALPLWAAPAPLDFHKFTTGTTADGCQPEGTFGDPDLNLRKNRDLPPPTFTPMTIAQILANHPPNAQRMHPNTHRATWSRAARDDVAAWESRGATVVGFIVAVEHEGPEPCNCMSETQRDFHAWVAASGRQTRKSAVVMEISPRLLSAHPTWTETGLTNLARKKAHCRISGWLMWDQAHPDEVGVIRGTLWEVHPIHKIEIDNGSGGWKGF